MGSSYSGSAYEIKDVIGKGGFGIVFKATHHPSGEKEVAIKKILKVQIKAPGSRQFDEGLLDVRKMKVIDNPHIAKTLDVYYEKTFACIVMEYYPTSLSVVLDGGELPIDNKFSILKDISTGVVYLHSEVGIIHTNLKPSNIFITETGSALIGDYGLARISAREHLGALAYVPPEVVSRNVIEEKSDVYSMGLVFCSILDKDMRAEIENRKPAFCLTMVDDEHYHIPLSDAIHGSAIHGTIVKMIQRAYANRPTAPNVTEQLNKCTQNNLFHKINNKKQLNRANSAVVDIDDAIIDKVL